MPRGTLLATLLAGLAMAAPAAAAPTVAISSDDAVYTGEAGVDTLTVTDAVAPVPPLIRFRFAQAGIIANAGCIQDGLNAAYCDIDPFYRARIDLGAGNDVFVSNTTLDGVTASGGTGDDTLTGSDADGINDSLMGEEDKDTLIGRGGDDSLDTGPGDGDSADGGAGDDSFSFGDDYGAGDVNRGGPGIDKVFTFGDSAVTVDLAADTAAFAGGARMTVPEIEDADGDDHGDRLLGDDGINDLEGEEGADFIDGRGGPDFIEGETGDDTIESREGSADFVDGSGGTDTCNSDQLDTRVSCETGLIANFAPFGSQPPPDRTAPTCTRRGLVARPKLATLRRRGVSFRASCNESGRVVARLVGALKGIGRSRIARAGDLELGTRTVKVTAGREATVRVAIGRKLRRFVRRRARLRLEIRVVDAAGNERTASAGVRPR